MLKKLDKWKNCVIMTDIKAKTSENPKGFLGAFFLLQIQYGALTGQRSLMDFSMEFLPRFNFIFIRSVSYENRTGLFRMSCF